MARSEEDAIMNEAAESPTGAGTGAGAAAAQGGEAGRDAARAERSAQDVADVLEAAEAAEAAEEVLEDVLEAGLSEIDLLRAELEEMKERFMRALADAENTRKRASRERAEAERYGANKLARDLLGVYDSLSRALETVSDEQKAAAGPLIEGVELTLRELVNVFSRHGITPITPEVGERFDPQLHEAMFEAPVPGTRAGEIIQVTAHGFMMHDRLLRPAKVGVSSYRDS